MRSALSSLMLLLLGSGLYAQTALDSLWQQANLASSDTAALRIRLQVADQLVRQQTDSGIMVSRQLAREATALKYGFGVGEATRCIATGHWYLDANDSAFFYFDRARQLFERALAQHPQTDVALIKERHWRASLALMDLGIRLGKFAYVEALMDQLDAAPLPTDDVGHLGRYGYYRGFLYSKMNDHERSVEACLRFLSTVEEPLPDNYMWDLNAYSLLGSSFEELEDLANSKKYFDKCMALGEARNFASWIINPLRSNYAKFLLENAAAPELGGSTESGRMSNIEAATQLMRQVLQATGDSEYNRALYWHRLGEAFYYKAAFDSAAHYHRKAANWLNQNGFESAAASVLLNLSNCELELGQLDAALEHALEGLHRVQADSNYYMQRFAHETCYQVYKALGQPEQSLLHHEQFKHLNDSITDVERLVKINDLEAKAELRQTEQELAHKETELALSEEVSAAKNNILLAIGLGVLLLLALVLVLLRTNQQRKRSNVQLLEQREVIQKNLQEKEVLIREVHHRVKNNLQVVEGMLHLQARRMKDPRLDVALQDARDRIASMAKVHELFYQGEALVDIPFSDYITALSKDISSFYQGSNITIRLVMNAASDRFNIDQTIPLGIIASELVSNAYKHAFHGGAGGSVVIELNTLPDGRYELAVADTGTGLPADFDPGKSKSMGLSLVRSLARQLQGKFVFSNQNGARFAVQFQASPSSMQQRASSEA